MRNVVLEGDVLEQLASIPEKSIQCCVTSPPYWGLRDYGHRRWFGGTPDCDHGELHEHEPHHPGQVEQTKWADAEGAGKGQTATTHTCQKCMAWYGQLGLEPTPEAYVAHMVEVFREVRRVLKDDGTLFLNLGDSYCSTGPGTMGDPIHRRGIFAGVKEDTAQTQAKFRPETPAGMKPKDLVGIPWMVAFALRTDGWYLRSDIIWHKPNVMPESVQDRPTKCHEYIFLLTKSAQYFYDSDAIREPAVTTHMPGSQIRETTHYGADNGGNAGLNALLQRYKENGLPTTRNKRTVWSINPKPYKGAHFATFPEELPEVCIKAGTSEKGACPYCGAPWSRSTVKKKEWAPSCECPPAEPVPCIVLDPFAGSGTTLAVAKYLRRDYVGVELNPEYIRLIEERVRPAEELESERQGFDLMLELEPQT